MKTLGLFTLALSSAAVVLACSPHPTAQEVVDKTAPVACEKAKSCNGDGKFNLAYPNGIDDCIKKVKTESEKKFGSDLSKSSVCTDEEVPGQQVDAPDVAIEVDAQEIARFADPQLRTAIVNAFREAGFVFVALDLLGYRSGSMNATLP